MSDESSVTMSAPLALRELLDYIAPGGCFLLSILVFDACLHRGWELAHAAELSANLHTPLYGALSFLYQRASGTGSWPVSALIASVLLGAAYIAGHVVASVSALVIERTFVFKGYGYPYENLLALRTPDQNAADGARRLYHAIFYWGNGVLLALIAAGFARVIAPDSLFHRASQLGAWLAGGILAALLLAKSFAILLRYLDRTRFSSTSRKLREGGQLQAAYYNLIRYSSGPYELLAGGLSRVLNTRNAFETEFLNRYGSYFKSWFKEDFRVAGTNNFWLSYCFVNEKSEALAAMLHNFRMQYSFARNIAAAFYLSALYSLGWMRWYSDLHLGLSPDYRATTVIVALGLMGAASLMLIRYYYLFVCYFSKFVFRGFVAINDIDEGGLEAARPNAGGLPGFNPANSR